MANGATISPATNPFDELPFPSPGEPIKAADFRKLSQSLRILYDLHALCSTLLGRTLAEARSILSAQRLEIRRIMTVFGNELATPADASLDQRKIVQVLPDVLGGNGVLIVLTEAVDTRKFAPNLMGLTYGEASERLRAFVGDSPGSAPVTVPQWIGHTLAEAGTLQ